MNVNGETYRKSLENEYINDGYKEEVLINEFNSPKGKKKKIKKIRIVYYKKKKIKTIKIVLF